MEDSTYDTLDTAPQFGAAGWAGMNKTEFGGALVSRLTHETPVLSVQEADELNEFIRHDAATRQTAAALSSIPFSELCRRVEEDREFARAVLDTYRHIDPSAYRLAADALTDTARRLASALAGRADAEQLLAE